MDSSRKQRWQQLQSVFEPGFRRMLLVSFLLHLLLPVLYHTPWFPKKDPVKPPVYRVNLVNKPVKKPQAGRPEAAPVKKKPPKKVVPPKAKPVKPKPIPPKPKPVTVKAKPKPASKPTPRTVSKPEPTSAVSKAQENALQKRLEELRTAQAKKRAEQERKDHLDALRAAVAAESQQVKSPVADAPVGSVTGKGDEIGVDERDYVREFITRQWRLSQYQLATRQLEAVVLLVYSAEGKLRHYRFEEKSGNEIFDSSLLRAILKSKDLGQPLQEQTDFTVIFNLKDMLDRP
ncbi:MAG: TonB C-terminal domain-containing protein [Chloroflexi bacterium]|nr:TonB C-terminal domain-containing protein [Chloroflexota bacterium]